MTLTLRDRIAAHFRAHPGAWIDMHALAQIGGTGGWRTRVSDCRRHLGMTIDNRTRRTTDASGQHWTISEYRYMPPVVVGQARLPLSCGLTDERGEAQNVP